MLKKILLLGGSFFQVPAVKMARKLGYYAITCDYLPDNPGHAYANEYHNVSTTDLDAVLKLAEKLKIDGIVAYASDPAAPTAAFVAEKLGLPGNPYEAVYTLTHKDLYRKFLKENGFAVPKSIGVESFEEFQEKCIDMNFPIVIKPTDSSGSRGVTILREPEGIQAAFAYALDFSRCKRVIVEEYVEKVGYQIAGDGFLVSGKLVFRCFANEHFDYSINGIVPIGESFPYIGSKQLQTRAHNEVQRLLNALEMRQGALNFDFRIDKEENIHLMEVGPRNGGNLIPEVTKYVTGIDMIEYTIRAAMGENCKEIKLVEPKGFYASYVIHSRKLGKYKCLKIENRLKKSIVEKSIWKKQGDSVERFNGSNQTVGTMIFRFDNQKEMLEIMDNDNKYINVILS